MFITMAPCQEISLQRAKTILPSFYSWQNYLVSSLELQRNWLVASFDGAISPTRVIIPVNRSQQFNQEDLRKCDALVFSRLLF
jgi:hypothetical protein